MVKRDKHGFPDPLHIELPHHHKKLLEAIYIAVIAATIVLILLLGNVGVMDVQQANVSAMVVLFLSILLGFMVIEKSMVSHKPKARAHRGAHKPANSSS
jgi:Na+-transporting methylmalonyl-CoA/oxaloacetate decarboxylase gamma subunit